MPLNKGTKPNHPNKYIIYPIKIISYKIKDIFIKFKTLNNLYYEIL